jgi:hypothetical protein
VPISRGTTRRQSRQRGQQHRARTPETKARSACSARSHGVTASTFAVVRLEDLDEVAHLKADLTAVYQPVNSQELFALERRALTQQAMLRTARLESGLFTTCLNAALVGGGEPFVPMTPDLAGNGDLSLDIEITRAQNRNYALADGFHRIVRQPNSRSLFLRYQAQAERHYHRAVAVEEFDRPKSLRAELPNEPILEVQPEENATTCAGADEPISTIQPPPSSQGHFRPTERMTVFLNCPNSNFAQTLVTLLENNLQPLLFLPLTQKIQPLPTPVFSTPCAMMTIERGFTP